MIAKEQADADREKRRSAASRGTRRGFLAILRMRPGSLLPLLILALIVVVILRVLPKPDSQANIDGWHAVLQARVFGDTLLVGVGFSRLGPGGAERAPESLASVLFMLPDTGEQSEASGFLQESRVALRTRMRYMGQEKTLRAIVRIDGESRTLSLPIAGP